MTFDQTVIITEYFYPTFSFPGFFSSVGGALGLWLGLGVMQIGEYSVRFINILTTMTKKEQLKN